MHAFTHRLIQIRLSNIPHFAQRILLASLAFVLTAQSVLADPITYKQLRQDSSSRTAAATALPATPNVARLDARKADERAANTQQPQAPVAKESPTHPEFVRLPDGRIVRYGPGILCEENCAEPAAPAAFREGASRLWWIIPPIIAGGILCAVLCRPGDNEAQPTPTIIIPQPTLTPIPTATPTVAPTIQPSPTGTPVPTPTVAPTVTPTPPPPAPVPEPGTVALFGLGLTALVARHRRKNKQRTED